LPRYLGADPTAWKAYDAVEIMAAAGRAVFPEILIDQGLADKFLHQSQLLPEQFAAACAAAQQPLQLRRHEGYDHSYYFISTFMEDHLVHHARILKA